MRKLARIGIIVALLLGAFYLGTKYGERSVILNQDIWTDGEYHYAEYDGQIHYYSN